MGKISVGEELTVTYVDYLNLSEDRKRILKQQYYFDCTCDHCTNKTKDDLKMAGAEVEGVKVSFCKFPINWFDHLLFIIFISLCEKSYAVL